MSRIAGMLHDGLSQTLNGALFFAHYLANKTRRAKQETSAEKQLLQVLTRAVGEARELHLFLQGEGRGRRAKTSVKTSPRKK